MWRSIATSRRPRRIRWSASSTLRIWRRCWNCAASSAGALTRFQKHSHARHLSNHVDLPERIQTRLLVRGRMRLHEDLARVRRTPTTAVTFTMFQEIDRAVHFVGPTIDGDPPPGFVDQHQRTGTQDRVHGPIFQADKAVTMLAHIPAVQKTEAGGS